MSNGNKNIKNMIEEKDLTPIEEINTPNTQSIEDPYAEEISPKNKKEEAKKQKELLKLQKEEQKRQQKLAEMEEKARREKEKADNAFLYEGQTEVKDKQVADYINDWMTVLFNLPKKIKDFAVEQYNNLTFVKDAKNKEQVNREVMKIDFEGDDAKRSEEKQMYEYIAKGPDGKIVKGLFEAYSRVEVHSYLLSEGYEIYSIKTNKTIQFIYGGSKVNTTKIKTKDLIFLLTQLSTYIKAGIPLVESLKILSRQFKNTKYQKIFRSLIYELTMGETFSEALAKQGEAFPRLLINMVKASELTGELPEALDDMAEYYTEIDATRRQMISAMMYPTIVFVFAIAVMTFIMVYVIPKFVQIYESMDNAAIPAFTQAVLDFSTFLQTRWWVILLFAAAICLIFYYLYKNVKVFKTMVQNVIMRIPVIGQVVIYNEVTMFTKTFSSLLEHNVYITESMEILNRITNNEVYKEMILNTITNLAKGERISAAFKDQWAFPIPAYEMIVTGERTGQLAEMMDKVSKYYQELHSNSVARIKAFIEPILIVFLTFMVGVIVLSVVIPMFNMYSAIQG